MTPIFRLLLENGRLFLLIEYAGSYSVIFFENTRGADCGCGYDAIEIRDVGLRTMDIKREKIG